MTAAYQRHFAWLPVKTEDWGWKWLRFVYRRRMHGWDYDFQRATEWWSYEGESQTTVE